MGQESIQEQELRNILCPNCFGYMKNWTNGQTAIPFVPCDKCLPKLGEWLKTKGINPSEIKKNRIDSNNPFPHPESRKWHPQAVPIAHLLLLVISDHSDQPNAWKDDIIYYLKWWAKQKENTEEMDEKSIKLYHLVEGLRSLINALEGDL